VLLEVGCGSGSAVFPILKAAAAATTGVRAVAIDVSPRAVALAEARAAQLGVPRARFAAAACDVATEGALRSGRAGALLAEVGGAVDLTLMVFVLSAIAPGEPQRRAARNILEATRPGGVVLVRDYGLYDCKMLRWPLERRAGRRLFVRHANDGGTLCYFFSTDALASLMLGVGFELADAADPPRYCTVRNRNRKSGASADRVFVRGAFRRPVAPPDGRARRTLSRDERSAAGGSCGGARSPRPPPRGDREATSEVRPGEVRPGEVRHGEVRLTAVRVDAAGTESRRASLGYAASCSVAEVARNICVNLGHAPDQANGVVTSAAVTFANAGDERRRVLGASVCDAQASLEEAGVGTGATVFVTVRV
jgi:SAM-dependent methyltransferase